MTFSPDEQRPELSREKVLSQAARYEIQHHLEHTSFGIIQWDSEARMQYLTDRISDFIDWPADRLIGRELPEVFNELVLEEDLEPVLHKFQELLEGNVLKNTVDLRVRRSDGSLALLRTTNSSMRDSENRLISILTIFENLTEVERTRHTLREESEKLQLFLENTSDVISRIDSDGTYRYVSPSVRTMTGHFPEELIGRNVYEFFHADDIPAIEKAHEIILRSAEPRKVVHRFRCNDGFWIWTESICKGIRFPDSGEISEIHASTRDISDRIHAEEQLIESLEEKEVLLKEIHHRVKNNLAVISGLLELQMISLPHPEVKRAFTESQLRLKSMALIHEKLYESSQLARIDLHSVIETLVDLNRNLLDPENSVHLLTDVDSIEMNINQALPTTLIVNEVISNAFQHAFTPRQENPQIRITINQIGQSISVDLRDNGSGFPDEVLQQQSESTGMTIISTLIEQLNAELCLSNNPGGTVRFSFRIENKRGSSSAHVQ